MIKDIFELQNPWRQQPDCQFTQKPRDILNALLDNIDNDKIIGIIGSRQVGKSSVLYLLIRHLLFERKISPADIFYFNLDDLKLHELFENVPDFLNFIGKSDSPRRHVFIDEAQRLPSPGLFLKEIHDLQLNLKIFYSGSSHLELKSKTREYLVGRSRTFELQRLSFEEYMQFNAPITPQEALNEMLIYGAYPEVSLERNPTQKKLLIKDIFQTYVEKDIVDFSRIENVQAFNNLVKLVAMQSGKLLNLDSLSKALRLGRTLIEKYIQILESTFVVRRIYPFYRNYKKEIIKTPKIYFLDLGLRNFILNNFNAVEFREDAGILFENLYLLQLLALDIYNSKKINYWRTTNGTEIDFIVQGEDEFSAIEVKWDKDTAPRSFKTIKQYYPGITTRVVTRRHFLRSENRAE